MNTKKARRFLTIPKELFNTVWIDKLTNIKGYISIYGSPHMRAAGGGLRVGLHLSLTDAQYIASVMYKKIKITGPGNIKTGLPMNGAGIVLQAHPKQITPELIIRFIKENRLIEKGIGTAASTAINIDGVCKSLGLVHLQEPIAHGLKIYDSHVKNALKLVNKNVLHPISERHSCPTNLATGICAAEIVDTIFEELKNKKIGIIGFGAVGGSFAHQAVLKGAIISFVANSNGSYVLRQSRKENKKDIAILLSHIKTTLNGSLIPTLHYRGSQMIRKVSTFAEAAKMAPIDILVIASPEGLVSSEMLIGLTSSVSIVSLANKPLSNNNTPALSHFSNHYPSYICNIGNAVLFSLCLLGCRVKSSDALLKRTITCSIDIARSLFKDSKEDFLWHKIVPKYLD
ncbi:MAG: hypothetical protein V1922_05490 [bacterium]